MAYQLFIINFTLVCLALFVSEVVGGESRLKREFFIYGWLMASAASLALYIIYLYGGLFK